MRKTFVVSKASRRGVHGVACDLLRVVCRVRAREVREALRGRLAVFSSGYLVTETEHVFSERRGRHVYGADMHSCTSRRVVIGLRSFGGFEWLFDGPIDAPEWISAGGVRSSRSGMVVFPVVVRGCAK